MCRLNQDTSGNTGSGMCGASEGVLEGVSPSLALPAGSAVVPSGYIDGFLHPSSTRQLNRVPKLLQRLPGGFSRQPFS